MYSKRAGLSGISGHQYEIKLISLLYLRAIRDERIVDFRLASNVDEIGAFDDICFKAKIKDRDKPVIVFIQARYSERFKHFTIDLSRYFDSYKKIRQHFSPYNREQFFRGEFNETDCLFVIYTNAKVDFSDKPVESAIPSALNDLMDTGGTVQQPYKSEAIIENIVKKSSKTHITSVATRIAKYIMNEEMFKMMPTDELLQRYHVILAQKVFNISEIQPEGHRYASFRPDFFHTDEKYLILFKDTLYNEFLGKREVPSTEIDNLLSELSAAPEDATILSKLIGTVVIYEGCTLLLKQQYLKYTRYSKPVLNIYVSPSTVNKAVEIAAQQILSHMRFKVPAYFGNVDLTIYGKAIPKEYKIDYFALRISDLIHKCKSTKVVTIDGMDDRDMRSNLVLAGAIGNIFVVDDKTNLMKITDNKESLGPIAKKVFDKLNDLIDNLHEYKFYFKGATFPKLSFNCYSHEESLATDFLNKLVFYSNQAVSDVVEKHIKNEIEDYQRDQSNYFQAKTDVIFLKYYDEIQKWWQSPMAQYLTRKSDLIWRILKSSIIESPLLTIISTMYMNKLTQYNYTFTEDAVKSLSLQDQHSSTVIIAENTVLTVLKVIQYLKNKDHAVLDFEYIVNLPINDRNALSSELRDINKGKVLIFVCDKMQNSRNAKKTLENISKVIQTKNNIVITNPTSIEILQYFPKAESIIHDKSLSLIDMSEESQKRIIENATVKFGFVEMNFDLLMKGWPSA